MTERGLPLLVVPEVAARGTSAANSIELASPLAVGQESVLYCADHPRRGGLGRSDSSLSTASKGEGTDLEHRGVNDKLMVACGGLTGCRYRSGAQAAGPA